MSPHRRTIETTVNIFKDREVKHVITLFPWAKEIMNNSNDLVMKHD